MIQVTEAEWRIMECLWDHAPQAMSEITRTLDPSTHWTRHTVITLLKRLTEKGAVSVESNGYVNLYTPLISKEEATAFETRKLVNRAFGGQPAMLVSNLVDSYSVKKAEVVYYKLLGLKEREISERLGIFQSSVNTRSTNAQWGLLNTEIKDFENMNFERICW